MGSVNGRRATGRPVWRKFWLLKKGLFFGSKRCWLGKYVMPGMPVVFRTPLKMDAPLAAVGLGAMGARVRVPTKIRRCEDSAPSDGVDRKAEADDGWSYKSP